MKKLIATNNGRILAVGRFTTYDDEFTPYYRDIVVNNIGIGNLSKSSITSASFVVKVGYFGDANNNATVTAWVCNNTQSPGCDPLAGNAKVLGQIFGGGAGEYFGTINSFPTAPNPGDVINIKVVAADADGASPVVTGTVTLAP